MNREVMPLVYADQSADALHLTLIGGAFEPEQFHVLDQARLVLGAVEVEAGIIGQSHYFRVSGPGIAFAEVVACTPVEAACVHGRRRLRRLPGGEWVGNPGGLPGYRFRVHRRPARAARPLADRLEAAARTAARSAEGIGLLRAFPVGPRGLEARTVIWLRPVPGGLLVRTLHAYPNERANIFTRSAIRLP